MARLEVERVIPDTDVMKLRSPVNWTAVLFFASLSALHLFFATAAFLNRRWEAYLSIIFGVAFALASIACGLIGTEVAVLVAERRLRLRTGTRRFYAERSIPFSRVRSVRLTLLHPRAPKSSTIELVCEHEVIDCPPTCVPREEALCLAVTMGVRLVKVYGDSYGPVSDRINNLASHSELD